MQNDYLISESNSIEYSVSEISNKIKYLLENNFESVCIKGEISGLKIATSGHGYFSLKDSGAVLAAICWRHVLSRVNFKLEEGLEIIVSGKITAYAGQSKYQISVESIRPHGIGAFIQILNKRRMAFEEEGLFNKKHKQSLPYLPKKIGIITSLTGAVIKDIIHRISDRCPTNLIIWPVSVQGETSAKEITNAIIGFNKLDDNQKPDLLIIARGGGSIEDLWSFNEEIVVRAAFNSTIPIISAVGHETDYTLLDLVADVRAPTPTAAAEFAVPVLFDLKYTIQNLHNRIHHRLLDLIRYYYQKVVISSKIHTQTQSVINNYLQRTDELSFRLNGLLPQLLQRKIELLQYFPINRLKPNKILKYKYMQYKNASDNLLQKSQIILNSFEQKFQLSGTLLDSLDYKKILNRGFAIVKNDQGMVISSIKDAQANSFLTIAMKDGEINLLNK